jgi:hypothetical protein
MSSAFIVALVIFGVCVILIGGTIYNDYYYKNDAIYNKVKNHIPFSNNDL